MDIFLKAKAWQIFLVLVILPFGTQMLVMQSLISSFETNPELIFMIMPIVMLAFLALFLLWFWSLGVGINKRIPVEIRPRSKFFKFAIIYSAIYMLIFQLFFIFAASGSGSGGHMAIIFPLHLFGMYCMFYGLYFITKNIATFEENKPIKFSSFAGSFFLLWFFPIGIWLIQPRINKLYASANT